jgi:hypothetical protein
VLTFQQGTAYDGAAIPPELSVAQNIVGPFLDTDKPVALGYDQRSSYTRRLKRELRAPFWEGRGRTI